MIQIRIDMNITPFFKSLDQLETSLSMLKEPLEALGPTLRKIFDVKFRNFERHRHTYTKSYKQWKDQQNLPVGVKTGKTKNALVSGGEGVIDKVELHAQSVFVYNYGINVEAFRNRLGYPGYFNEWLERRGDELVGLSAEEAEFIIGELAANIRNYIDTLY